MYAFQYEGSQRQDIFSGLLQKMHEEQQRDLLVVEIGVFKGSLCLALRAATSSN